MHCPLCGAENPNLATQCQLCDSSLIDETGSQGKHIVLESVDLTQSKVQWSRLAILLTIFLAISLPWVFMWDLFQVPLTVQESREAFTTLFENYQKDPQRWIQKKNQILRRMYGHQDEGPLGTKVLEVDRIEMEVALAYLVDDLELQADNVALYAYPEDEGVHVLLSKYEEAVWPLKILVSLEFGIRNHQSGTNVHIYRLRRGSRDVPEQLAWKYFEPELAKFRRLESFSGGMSRVMLTEGSQRHKAPELSWDYQHHALQGAF